LPTVASAARSRAAPTPKAPTRTGSGTQPAANSAPSASQPLPPPSVYQTPFWIPSTETVGPCHRVAPPPTSILKQPGAAPVSKGVRFRGGMVKMVEKWMEPGINVWRCNGEFSW
jgi:hypothetical protein